MMQLLRKCECNTNAISRVFRVLLYSTETQSSNAPRQSLRSRISPAMKHRLSVVPALEQWRKEGGSFKEQELQKLIRTLRMYKRYNHALEICEWMRDKCHCELSPGQAALELNLISKVHGLEQVEKYFNETSNSLRSAHVYGALLNCYSQEKLLEKAEVIMQMMRDLKLVSTLSYNSMLSLYYQLGKHDKIDNLIQEMKENGIIWNKSTYYIHMSAYAAISDIEGMDKVLTKWEADPAVNTDYNMCVVSSKGYLQAGLKEKATDMLKKSEHFMSKSKKFHYEVLLTLYATMGNKTEVCRIWNLHKSRGRFFNTGYLAMIDSLLKLDDMDGAADIFEEWISSNLVFDFRVPNLLIHAYCKRGLLEKAEKLVSRVMEKGEEPTATTWDHLAAGYQENNQMEKAVEKLKKALLASSLWWKPNPLTLRACLEFLKEKRDIEEAENLIRLLREHSLLPADVSDRMVNYIRSEQPGSNTIAQTLGDHEATDEVVGLEQESLN